MAPYKDGEKRNHALTLFRSFLDLSTQEQLEQALPSFQEKPILIQFGDEDSSYFARLARDMGDQVAK
jgi:hypothetical protein